MSIVYTIGNYARTTERGGVRFLFLNDPNIPPGEARPLLVGGAAYKVPAGKKFIVTEVYAKGGTTVAQFSGSTSQNTAGTAFLAYPLGSTLSSELPSIPIYAEIGAGKYVVVNHTHESSRNIFCYMYGIEVDA